MPKSIAPEPNRLLAKLGKADRAALHPHLTPVTLEYKKALYEAFQPIEFVYFIESGVASLVSTMANGSAAEVGTVGNEGVVGLPISCWATAFRPPASTCRCRGRGFRSRRRGSGKRWRNAQRFAR